MAGPGKKIHFWSEGETIVMIRVLKEMDIMKYLDGRKHRNGDIFKKVADRMKEEGFLRLPEQVRNRWKMLKTNYYAAKKQNATSGSHPTNFPFFNLMDGILGHRPLSNMDDSGVDIGFELDVTSTEADGTAEDDVDDEDDPSADNITATEQQAVNNNPVINPGEPRKKRNSKSARPISHHQQFLLEMLAQQNQMIQSQIQQSEEREEKLLTALMESNARSNERMITMLVEGFRGAQPQPQSMFVPFQGDIDYARSFTRL